MTVGFQSSYLAVAKKKLAPAVSKKLGTKATPLCKEQLPKVLKCENPKTNKINMSDCWSLYQLGCSYYNPY